MTPWGNLKHACHPECRVAPDHHRRGGATEPIDMRTKVANHLVDQTRSLFRDAAVLRHSPERELRQLSWITRLHEVDRHMCVWLWSNVAGTRNIPARSILKFLIRRSRRSAEGLVTPVAAP
jgi:hypothetical protein